VKVIWSVLFVASRFGARSGEIRLPDSPDFVPCNRSSAVWGTPVEPPGSSQRQSVPSLQTFLLDRGGLTQTEATAPLAI
jgi:hypothetical protein